MAVNFLSYCQFIHNGMTYGIYRHAGYMAAADVGADEYL
jgi:hypothetical protein